MSKISINQIIGRKGGEKILCLTAYTYPIAKIVDNFCEIILVGDSLGMTIYGMNGTTEVSLEMMINHGLAVTRAASKSLVVVDLPCGSYENSAKQALESAKKVIAQTNCDAIKIEITPNLVDTTKFLVDSGINVMGHVGLLPQHVKDSKGYKYQGRDDDSAKIILETAQKIAEAGAFALVIEAVPAQLATRITREISIPTIGIGASAECDGQVLVIDDLIGLNQDFKPKFVTKYGSVAEVISDAVQRFRNDVKSGIFPRLENLV